MFKNYAGYYIQANWAPERFYQRICQDFLSELVLAADKVLILSDFNIHVDDEKDALGLA